MGRIIRDSSILASVAIMATAVVGSAASPAADNSPDIAALYHLQAAFHAAASVHDAVNGDTQAVIDQRVSGLRALAASASRPSSSDGQGTWTTIGESCR